jgi:hypothetical protein
MCWYNSGHGPLPFSVQIDHDVYNVKSDVHALAAQNSSGNPSVARMISPRIAIVIEVRELIHGRHAHETRRTYSIADKILILKGMQFHGSIQGGTTVFVVAALTCSAHSLTIMKNLETKFDVRSRPVRCSQSGLSSAAVALVNCDV